MFTKPCRLVPLWVGVGLILAFNQIARGDDRLAGIWADDDGDIFLIGDLTRMVVARKIEGSETVVVEKTQDPVAMKGELGSILGRWTANMTGQSAELVFREDGEFRLSRCVNDVISQDYGLYAVDMETRRLVSDSRFLEIQTRELDFYGDTSQSRRKPPSRPRSQPMPPRHKSTHNGWFACLWVPEIQMPLRLPLLTSLLTRTQATSSTHQPC